MVNGKDMCKDILKMDKGNSDIKKLQNLCMPNSEESRIKREFKELREVTDDTIDTVVNGIITGLALAIAFLIYTPLQQAILYWLVGYPAWLSTIITIGILVGMMILISYIFVQIRQFRAKEDIIL